MATDYTFDKYFIPSELALQKAIEREGVTVDPALLKDAEYGILGNERAGLTLYVDALTRGIPFNDLAAVHLDETVDPSQALGGFIVTVARFQLDFDARAVFGQLNASANAPRNLPTVNYAALATHRGFSPLLINEILELRQEGDEASFPYIHTIQPALDIVELLKAEGHVISMEDALKAATFWTPAQVLVLFDHKMTLDEALKFQKNGITDMNEIVEFNEKIPEVWVDELLDD